MDRLGEKLSPQFRVIAYDLRGRGNSDKPSNGYNIPQHATDLLGLLDALSLDKPVLLGHSLGAAISDYFASQHPDRVHRLILVDGGGAGPNFDWGGLLKQIKPLIDRLSQKFKSVEDYIDSVKSAYRGDWSEYAERAYRYDAGKNKDGTISSKLTKERALQDFNGMKDFDPNRAGTFYYVWDSIQCPTLVLRAPGKYLGKSPVTNETNMQVIASVIPNCQYVEIKDSNHATIIMGENVATSEVIRKFLEDPKPKPNLDEKKRESFKGLAYKGVQLWRG
jgi:pimeloyl-ACP methyl ester carboxylesterase